MVGVGGKEAKEAHAAGDGRRRIRRMPLAAGDLVYLSPFIEQPRIALHRRRQEAGLTPMPEQEIEDGAQAVSRNRSAASG